MSDIKPRDIEALIQTFEASDWSEMKLSVEGLDLFLSKTPGRAPSRRRPRRRQARPRRARPRPRRLSPLRARRARRTIGSRSARPI